MAKNTEAPEGEAAAAEAQSKYSTLTANFMRGSFKGQIASAFKALKGENPTKANEFVAAIRAGDISIPDDITPQARRKLLEMGLEEELLPATVDGEGQAAAAEATNSEADEAAAAEAEV